MKNIPIVLTSCLDGYILKIIGDYDTTDIFKRPMIIEHMQWYGKNTIYATISNVESPYPDELHQSHITRDSDASSYDEICIACGATDRAGGGWGDLANPCKNQKQ